MSKLTPAAHWSRTQLESAQDLMLRALDPIRDCAGNWPTFMRLMIVQEIERLSHESVGLNVFTAEHQRRHAEIKGQVAVLERFLRPDMGLTLDFERELKRHRADSQR